MNLKPIVAAAGLIIMTAAPLAARQSPAADSSAAPLPVLPRDSVASVGPRVRADMPRVESLSASREPARRDVHTLRITTLVLVLGVIILVLLIT